MRASGLQVIELMKDDIKFVYEKPIKLTIKGKIDSLTGLQTVKELTITSQKQLDLLMACEELQPALEDIKKQIIKES